MSRQSRQINKQSINDSDIFDSYSNPYNLTKEQFLLVLRTFNFLLIRSVIDEGKVYSLPLGCGLIYMKKIKSKGKKIMDYNTYRKTGEIHYLRNLHSNGYIAQFF